MAKLITENDILAAKKADIKAIEIDAQAIITPLARDTAKSHQIEFVFGGQKKENPQKSITRSSPHTANGPVAIGSDHGGFEMKTMLCSFLKSNGYAVNDLGCYSPDPIDYPDIAHQVAQAVASENALYGIIVDGAGIGSAIVANKVPGIRAACCNDLFTAGNSREHNGANVLTLGGRVIGDELAKKIVLVWLQTDFGGGRHKIRLNKVVQIDQSYRVGK